ncbi:hypothetical protein C8R47DRAFT_1133811 [Mycena vitilis]|nr:hypothetical protein C8R47DRAFT_1133811 [Mycena vitilis]
MAHNSTTPTCLAALVERLGGHLESWIMNESLQRIPHGPVSIVGNTISATFEVAPRSVRFYLPGYSPIGTLTYHQRILVCWRALSPITALCAVIRPASRSEKVQTVVYPMDAGRPETQAMASHLSQPSDIPGWFSGPPAGRTGISYIRYYTYWVEDSLLGCIRVEFRKGSRNPINPGYDALDPHMPPIVFNFNLVTPEKHTSSSSLIQKRKRAASEIDDKQSVCIQPRKKAATECAMAGDAPGLAKLRRLKKDFLAKWLKDQRSSHFSYENSVEQINEAKDV